MLILVDFDGTCVKHDYPFIGNDVPYAVDVLKKLVDNGHRLILYTMRGSLMSPYSSESTVLKDAEKWFEDRGITLSESNSNREQLEWTDSVKIYGDLIIDDRSLGVPLIFGEDRPYVDWLSVDRYLYQRNLIHTLHTDNT